MASVGIFKKQLYINENKCFKFDSADSLFTTIVKT